MNDQLNILRKQIKGKDLDRILETIDAIISQIDGLTDILLESLTGAPDRFVISEKISMAFNSYLSKLESNLTSPDKDLRFWAATLLVHHKVKNDVAEDILIEEVKNGQPIEVYVATTILKRVNNVRINGVIKERLESGNVPDQQIRDFFVEKLSQGNPSKD